MAAASSWPTALPRRPDVLCARRRAGHWATSGSTSRGAKRWATRPVYVIRRLAHLHLGVGAATRSVWYDYRSAFLMSERCHVLGRYAAVILLAAGCAARNPGTPADTGLTPVSATFDDTADQGYRAFLRSALFKGQVTYRCLQMVTEFPVEAVFAECPLAGEQNPTVRLVHLREGADLSKAYADGVSPAGVAPRVTSAELDVGAFLTLEAAWWKVLDATTYPTEPRFIADGVRLHFLTFRNGIGSRATEARSPRATTEAASLANMGRLLAKYVDGPIQERSRLRGELLRVADTLLSAPKSP